MGAQTASQQQSAFPYTPSWLTPYYQQGANQATNAQNSIPPIGNLYNQYPGLQTAPLSGAELNTINQFGQNIGPNATSNVGVGALERFLGAPGTPSTATNAALNEFKTLQAPEILQQSALMGQGNSGAALQALTQGQESALVPFMQQDLANQLQAGQEVTSAGQNQEQITQQQLQNTLQAQDLPRQIQQQGYQNAFDQAMGRFNFGAGIQTGPLSNFPNLIGQIQNMKSSATQPKF